MTPMDLDRLLELLRRTYDAQDWWPSQSPFEVMVGAILTQRTTWEIVAKVLDRLREEDLLEVDRMACADVTALESILRPAGFYRQKAKRIKLLASYLVEDTVPTRFRCWMDRPIRSGKSSCRRKASERRRPIPYSSSPPGGRSSWQRLTPPGY